MIPSDRQRRDFVSVPFFQLKYGTIKIDHDRYKLESFLFLKATFLQRFLII